VLWRWLEPAGKFISRQTGCSLCNVLRHAEKGCEQTKNPAHRRYWVILQPGPMDKHQSGGPIAADMKAAGKKLYLHQYEPVMVCEPSSQSSNQPPLPMLIKIQ